MDVTRPHINIDTAPIIQPASISDFGPRFLHHQPNTAAAIIDKMFAIVPKPFNTAISHPYMALYSDIITFRDVTGHPEPTQNRKKQNITIPQPFAP